MEISLCGQIKDENGNTLMKRSGLCCVVDVVFDDVVDVVDKTIIRLLCSLNHLGSVCYFVFYIDLSI